jgi:hypothetical protein
MFRKTIPALVSVLVIVGATSAQTPARLRWQTGQVLLYKVEQSTSASEVVGENKVETSSKLNLTKRWQVLAVDAAGVATVQHSLVALRLETVTPGGETVLFDSANPEKSTPALKESLEKFVGSPLAVLRIDAFGRVLEVKESKFGPASSFENEPPFVGVLPSDGPKPGQTWDRTYNLTLDPPRGAGEKYPAVQHYACKSLENGIAVVTMTTELKGQPEALADRVPLMQLQPEGEIVYDLNAGRLHGATLKFVRELKGHQGEGSSARFTNNYVEQYAGDK